MPVVRTYDGRSFAPIATIDDAGACEVAFGMYPDTAQITLPATSANLAASVLAPGGEAVVVEVDATDLGCPVWIGRASSGGQWSPTSGGVSISLVGPLADLEEEPVQALRFPSATAAEVVRAMYEHRAVGWPLVLGTLAEGAALPVETDGQTFGGALTSLADERGETFALDATPRACEAILSWYVRPDTLDVSQDVILVQGVNCEPDVAMSLARSPEELVGVARSYLAGTGAVASKAVAPGGAVVGRGEALEAEVLTTIAATLGEGAGAPELSVTTPTRAALVAGLTARLQATLSPVVVAQAEVTDTSLWAKIRPGWVVRCRWPGEPSGLFADALLRVRTCTWSVLPPLGMTVSGELWRVGPWQ